jgi:hypothetical protein
MALLNDCSSNYYATLPACIESFTIKFPKGTNPETGLSPNTPYHYFVTDKFGHVYHQEVTTDADSMFEVLADDFPDGFFNPWNGQLIMELKDGMGYCEPVSFIVCGATFDKIVIDFKNGDFSTQIPCIC